jgi:hypothetical protein
MFAPLGKFVRPTVNHTLGLYIAESAREGFKTEAPRGGGAGTALLAAIREEFADWPVVFRTFEEGTPLLQRKSRAYQVTNLMVFARELLLLGEVVALDSARYHPSTRRLLPH